MMIFANKFLIFASMVNPHTEYTLLRHKKNSGFSALMLIFDENRE